MKSPLKYLKEISEELCPDYPNIENCNASERLWALESSLKGTNQANKECHQMIQILRKKLKLSNDDIFKIWETEVLK